MPSTYSPNLRIELIGTGEQSGTWGTTTNTNLGTLIEDAISGYVSVSVTSANQALTAVDGGADQSRNMTLNLTTTTSAAFNVYIPPAEKFYVVRNSSAYDATIYCSTVIGNTTAAGTGVTVLAGTTTMVFADGTNVASSLTAFSGSLIVSANSSTPALRVTQLGSGDSILVEDSANPDSSPFVVDASGNVGIGITVPTNKLTVSGEAVITASGSTTALRVTQTGSGNALLVEDVANPDSTPFVINAAGLVGIATTTPAAQLDIGGSTDAIIVPKGTTGQQPGTSVTGMIRYNTTTNAFEGYSGSSPAWKSIGGSTLSNDTATASNLYPVFAGATSGIAENLFTSNAKLLYKPSTGELSATVPRADNGIFVNKATVSTSYTIASGDNGMSAGTITVADGVTVTVSDGSFWTVV
jgi:hypothetical protein